ncbi:MAG TPA: hypothetical protein VN706_11425 [Gemmatimonadaceae bacterium]|nr:hypothetical protein [Gemmatimonadaceae bacterium]
MIFAVLWTAVVAMILGAIMGRAYERNAWQQRLLDRTGLLPDAPKRLSDAVRDVRTTANSAPQDLAQAVDAIALEVERIGEGQRFLTKLLAERDARITPRGTNSPAPGSLRSPVPPAS